VSDPHELSMGAGDFHRFIFLDVQMTLLPDLGWRDWNRAGFAGDRALAAKPRSLTSFGMTATFVRDDSYFRSG
jgi:hypothetical protein